MIPSSPLHNRNEPHSLRDLERAVQAERREKEPSRKSVLPLPKLFLDPINPSVTEALNALRMQLEAGVGLGRALRTAAPICRSSTAKSCFHRAADAVERSASFDDAMLAMSPILSFPERAILSAGWSAGRIDPSMEAVVRRREVMFRTRRELRSKLMLPMIQLFLAGFILNVPGLILGTLGWGEYLMNSLSVFSVVVGVMVIVKWTQYAATRMNAGREMESPVPGVTIIDRIVLRIPVVALVQRWRNRSEFAANMSTLLGAGVSTLSALGICARTLPNGVYRKQVQASAKRIEKEGCTIAETLSRGVDWPPEWLASLEAAHHAGEEEKVLGRLGESGREQYLNAVKLAGFWFGFLFYLGIVGYMAYKVLSFWQGYVQNMEMYLE